MKKARVGLLVAMSIVLAFTLVLSIGCSSSSNDNGAGATLSSIAVTAASSSTKMSQTNQLTATGTYSDASTKDLTATATWSSSDTAVATIAATGVATGVAAGTTTITATSAGVSGTRNLTVDPYYTVTLYMASEGGGHIGVYPAVIDPLNTTEPIQITTGSVTKIQLQGGPSSNSKIVLHDVRLDEAANRIYYSQFLRTNPTDSSISSNPSATIGRGHVGYVDLALPNTASTGNSNDATIDIDEQASITIAYALDNIGIVDAGTSTPSTPLTFKIMYCASGQNADYFFPMSMSFPAYIDAIPKSLITAGNHINLADIKRTYIKQIDDSMNMGIHSTLTTTIVSGAGDILPLDGPGGLGVPPLAFIHGATSKDGTKMYLSTNVMSGLTLTVNTAGAFRTYLLNTSDVISGTVTTNVLLATGTISGLTPTAAAGGSVAYRASFTPDGKYILQAGSDRMLMLDAASPTLAVVVDTKKGPNADTNFGKGKTGIENHDVTYTPDSKYAILAERYVDAAGQMKTSGVQLYDIAAKKFIGGISNTCGLSACHAPDTTTARPTCGVVGKFK
jgi:hypothetical protein